MVTATPIRKKVTMPSPAAARNQRAARHAMVTSKKTTPMVTIRPRLAAAVTTVAPNRPAR